MTIETPIARARGLGSAHTGAHHWWIERLTSVSTLLLFFWLGFSLLQLPARDQPTVVAWLADPIAAVPMLLLIVSTFWHLRLGLQVVIEDYVHEAGWKLFSILLLNFFTILLAATAVFAVLKIALGGAAHG